MAKTTIEVELRGSLNDSGYNKLMKVLKEQGSFLNKQRRFLLDYSTFLEGIGERKIDVRVRVTNGKVEIIVKKGKFGGTSREEVSVFPEGDNFENTLKLMSMLGYNKAVACDRGIVRYSIDGIEIAIQDVINFNDNGKIHSRFFEAEILCQDDSEKENAIRKIRDFLSSVELREFTENEWNDYVAQMNNEANGVFDFQKDDVQQIINLGK